VNLRFLGGAREVGRSAILIDDSLLLDYGLLTGTPPRYPIGDVDPDAVVLSHGHLDHVGAVPALLSGADRPEIHWTPPTAELARTLARDTLKLHGGTPQCPFTETEVTRITEHSHRHGYRDPFEIRASGGDGRRSSGRERDKSYEVTFFDAGHIPGSAHVLVDDGDTRLFYTGDFHVDESTGVGTTTEDEGSGPGNERMDGYVAKTGAIGEVESIPGQRLVAGSTARPEADVLLIESTYSDVEHGPREEVERRFAESVRTTLWEGGTVVIPAFAIGRTQELMLVCAAYDIPCYVDGMGTEVTEQVRRHPDFLRDANALRRANSHARFVTGRDGQRRRIAAENAAIITTSGMLSGGPAMTYIPEIRGHPVNKICLTGYQVAGTPGRELLDTGRAEIDGQVMPISARVEQYDFSAHVDRSRLLDFLESYEDSEILVDHGDRCVAFAEELAESGYDASAPDLGETITV
jgi:putative mRNA 3-end processing factor